MLSRMRAAWTGLVAAIALTAAAGRPALADPKPPSEKDKQIASELVKKAIARSQVGDHGAAIDIYLQAYTIVPNPTLLSNLGAEYQQSGKPKEALRYFCMYLEKDRDGANAPYATAQAKLLQAQLGNKNVSDDDVCAAPRPTPKRGGRPTIAPTETDTDEPTPRRPARDPGPAPGEVISREGTASQSSSSSLRIAALVTGVTGIASVGVGVWAGLKAKQISDDISSHPGDAQWTKTIRQIEADGQRYENIQVATLIAGGALLTTGIVLFLVDNSSSSSSGATDAGRDRSVHVVPTIAPTATGLAVVGRF